MTEQRKSRRFELRLPVEILANGTAEHSTGETRNMSSSGVLFTLPNGLNVGDAVEYEITFPRVPKNPFQVRLHCMGKVVREAADAGFAVTLERYEFIRRPT